MLQLSDPSIFQSARKTCGQVVMTTPGANLSLHYVMDSGPLRCGEFVGQSVLDLTCSKGDSCNRYSKKNLPTIVNTLHMWLIHLYICII